VVDVKHVGAEHFQDYSQHSSAYYDQKHRSSSSFPLQHGYNGVPASVAHPRIDYCTMGVLTKELL
jgi:hypothetical protein